MEELKNDVQFMKQYLKDLYTLEKYLYCSEQARNKIVDTINSLGHPKAIKAKGAKSSNVGNIILSIVVGIFYAIGGLIVGVIAGAIIAMIVEKKVNFDVAVKVWVIVAVLGTIVGFFWGFTKNKTESDIENLQYKAYQRELEQDNARVQREKALIPGYRKTENLYSQNIASCKKALDQLYSLDIIFPKYRNFIAISQIYEYYMSGRCTELEGHEGAYNIYENEVRQNIIIIQLNNVLNQLEQIKQNQYLIYQAIQEANLHLAQIESNTEAIKYNTAVTAENSAICARYAQTRVY